MRMCGRCGDEYPATLEYFHRNGQSKDKLHAYCKDCRSKIHKEYMRDPRVGDRVRKQVRIWQKGVGREKYRAACIRCEKTPKRILWRRSRYFVAKESNATLEEALQSLEKAKQERAENPLTWETLQLRPFKNRKEKLCHTNIDTE